MATRSAIGIKNKKGEIKAVYCHWDGYPDWVGRVLVENYDTAGKIEELLALGDISSLGQRVKPNENEVHTYDRPVEDVTIAYHRDRNDELIPADTSQNIEEFIAKFKDCWCEYFYVFEDGEWYVYETADDRKLVKDVLEEVEE